MVLLELVAVLAWFAASAGLLAVTRYLESGRRAGDGDDAPSPDGPMSAESA